jgi:tetratricopeptide (TPR) repeat protein
MTVGKSLRFSILEAQDLIRRRSDNSEAHFTLAYVMRYAGLLDQSAQECDLALGLDPGYYRLRSCAVAYFELGKTDRARDYFRLDANSEWGRAHLPVILLREGRIDEAEQAIKNVPDVPIWFKGLLAQCVRNGAVSDQQNIDSKSRKEKRSGSGAGARERRHATGRRPLSPIGQAAV